jgi:preprotein translocase subunit SecD
MKFTLMKVILIASFLMFCCFTSCAQETLQYELTQDKIRDVWMSEYEKGQYEVNIILNEPHKEAFSQLTGNNIGKRLSIVFSGRVLISPIIRDEIPSGSIRVADLSKEDAQKLVDALQPRNTKKNDN